MSTATNTTKNVAVVYALYDILSPGHYAGLTREPQERFKSGLCHLKLVITIPEGYRIGTSYDGNALLVSVACRSAINSCSTAQLKSLLNMPVDQAYT